MRGYVLSSAACGVSHIFPACGAPKFGVDPTPNLGRLYPCGSQNWDGRKKGACRHTVENEAIREERRVWGIVFFAHIRRVHSPSLSMHFSKYIARRKGEVMIQNQEKGKRERVSIHREQRERKNPRNGGYQKSRETEVASWLAVPFGLWVCAIFRGSHITII